MNKCEKINFLANKVYEYEERYKRIAMTNIFGKTEEEKMKINREYLTAQTEMIEARAELRKIQGL